MQKIRCCDESIPTEWLNKIEFKDTRNGVKAVILKTRIIFIDRNTFINTAKLFNSLLQNIKDFNNVKAFKRELFYILIKEIHFVKKFFV
jgi:hypothetical protein